MGRPHGSSGETKARILHAARELFAERGVSEVTMRDIGAAADVDHALIHQYFGTKEQLVEAILRAELNAVRTMPRPVSPDDFRSLRGAVDYFLGDGRAYLRLITRAELAGLAPERFLDPDSGGPLRLMAHTLAGVQAQSGAPAGQLPDPRLVAAVFGAATFAFATLAPWLEATLELPAGGLDDRRGELAEILVGLVVAASGVRPGAGQSPGVRSTGD